MIQNFDHTMGGQLVQLCASIGQEPANRVIISLADSAKTLVVFDASGVIGTLKAELEDPEQLIADAIRKAKGDGLIERAIATGAIQEARL